MASLIDKFGYGLGLCVEKVRGYGEAEALGLFDSLFLVFSAHVLSFFNISKFLYCNFSLFRQP